MVIGSGLLAKIFAKYNDVTDIIIFASGVSNSKETNPKAYKREFDLLKETSKRYPEAKLVYFSSASITDTSVSHNAYVKHKLAIEQYIKTKIPRYLILRVSNVVGAKGNPNTIMNFLVAAVKEQQPITLWTKAERNIIDVEDVFFIVDSLLTKAIGNTTVNIAVRNSIRVQDLLMQIECFIGQKAQVSYQDKGSALVIPIGDISCELNAVELNYGRGQAYINHLLKKYY